MSRKQEERAESKLFRAKSFCFESEAWERCRFERRVLTKVFRQSDEVFVNTLNQLRQGDVTDETLKMLNRCTRPLSPVDGVEPTMLFPRNKEVNEVNTTRLAQLPGRECLYEASDTIEVDARVDPSHHEEVVKMLWDNIFFDHCQASSKVRINVGAQVMLVRNIGRQLVNGTRGIVTRWIPKEEQIEELQNELKSMGDKDNKERIEKQIQWLRGSKELFVPAVRWEGFHCDLPALPLEFKTILSGTGICRRWQMPLKLAWALTIHKCQVRTIQLELTLGINFGTSIDIDKGHL